MKKTASTHWWILAAVCCCMLLSVAPSSAAESDASNATPKIDNMGFMKNPPKELVDRFPMCDEFLEVEWIDDMINTGQVKYNYFKDNRIGNSLIKIEHYIYFDQRNPLQGINYYDYKEGKVKSIMNTDNRIDPDIVKIVRNGSVEYEMDYAVTYKYKGRAIGILRGLFGMSSGISLSRNTKNVCVPYPGEEKVWIIEFATADNAYSNSERQLVIMALMSSSISSETKSMVDNFKDFKVLDVNRDGVDDFIVIGDVNSKDRIVYSQGDNYLEVLPRWESEADKSFGDYISTSNGKVCTAITLSSLFITTNGTSFFLNNQCNLKSLGLKK